jgi:hypothetical protein
METIFNITHTFARSRGRTYTYNIKLCDWLIMTVEDKKLYKTSFKSTTHEH